MSDSVSLTTYLMETCDRTAEAISIANPHRRGGWICYLFEGIDDELSSDEFMDLLKDTIENLTARLNEGRW